MEVSWWGTKEMDGRGELCCVTCDEGGLDTCDRCGLWGDMGDRWWLRGAPGWRADVWEVGEGVQREGGSGIRKRGLQMTFGKNKNQGGGFFLLTYARKREIFWKEWDAWEKGLLTCLNDTGEPSSRLGKYVWQTALAKKNKNMQKSGWNMSAKLNMLKGMLAISYKRAKFREKQSWNRMVLKKGTRIKGVEILTYTITCEQVKYFDWNVSKK